MSDIELEELIFKKALSNAYKHNGKADKNSVIRKLFILKPEIKSNIKQIIPIVNEIIEKVNAMSKDEQYSYLINFYPEELKEEKIQIKKELPPLPNYDKYDKIVTRFAPNPDGPLHIGNLRAAILSYEYAKRYDGKFILRFEDTDPRTKPPVLHIFEDEEKDYEYILRDLEWLGIFPDEVYIQSDRLKIYYDIASEIIKKNKAYVCFCSHERIKELRAKGIPCEHREQDNNLEYFQSLIHGEIKGVLRIKTDIKHPDPSVRDWIAFRIIDPKYIHPRIEKIEKLLNYRPFLWPTYNFSAAVDDHLLGVSHIFRAKEHLINTIKQNYLYEILNWKKPEYIHYGRLKLEKFILSKSEIKKGIIEGKYLGYDDPDLATIVSFKKRGFLPQTFKDIILEMGIKDTEATLSIENINSYNRKLIDPVCYRLFFVYEPVKLFLNINEIIKIKRSLHPTFKKIFEYELKPKNGKIIVYITKDDLKDEVRLIELGNFKIKKINGNYEADLLEDQSLEYAKKNNLKFIQWVPDDYKIECEIITPSYINRNKKIEGYVEREILNINESRFQFVRFGFVNRVKIQEKVICYFMHE